MALVQRADLLKGQYPDGAEGAGFPVEFYNHGEAGAARYVELELLSPLFRLQVGDSQTFETRWSLHALPSNDVSSAANQDAARELLTAP